MSAVAEVVAFLPGRRRGGAAACADEERVEVELLYRTAWTTGDRIRRQACLAVVHRKTILPVRKVVDTLPRVERPPRRAVRALLRDDVDHAVRRLGAVERRRARPLQ